MKERERERAEAAPAVATVCRFRGYKHLMYSHTAAAVRCFCVG